MKNIAKSKKCYENQIKDIIKLEKISKSYYDKLSKKLSNFIYNELKNIGYIPNKSKNITYCSQQELKQNDISIFNFQEKKNANIDMELKSIIQKKQNGENIGLYNNNQRNAFLKMLMLQSGDFTTVLCTFLLNIFKNIKYSIAHKKFLLTVVNTSYINQDNIPESMLYTLDELLTFICKKKINAYNWIFSKNRYTHEFKYFVTISTGTFVNFINKLIDKDIITIQPIRIIYNIDNINKVESLTNYFVVINQIKILFNELLTYIFSEDKEYMNEILDKLIELMNDNELYDLFLKGGQVYKMNVLNFIKHKPNVKLYDHKNKLLSSNLHYSDWDFSYKLKYKGNFVEEYNKFANLVQGIFSKFRESEMDNLNTKYYAILDKVMKLLHNSNITISENKSSADQKIYYVRDIPTYDINFDNFIFNKEIDRINNRYKLLDEIGRGGYNLYVMSNQEKNKHKITHLEIFTFNNQPLKTGINLIRLNSKFNINIKLDGFCCINFLSIAEIFDIATNKPSSFNNLYDFENIPNSLRFTNIKFNDKNYKTYSLTWYILDIVYYYIVESKLSSKKISRLFNSLIILLNTDKRLYNHIFTIKKQGKPISEWLNEILDKNKKQVINYKKYKKLIL